MGRRKGKMKIKGGKGFLRNLIFLGILIEFFTVRSFCEEVKKPNVAGSFYPASAKKLAAMVDNFIVRAKVKPIEGDIVAIIVPHAGYQFSGLVAGYSFKCLKNRKYETVIVIGPSHYFHFDGISVYNKGFFETPLGKIKVDSLLAERLIREDKKIKFYPQAFVREHSIEVELPFLQCSLKNFNLVPVVMGNLSRENCKILGNALAKLIKDKKVLLVISTDMSHFYPGNVAGKIDRGTIAELKKFNPESLFNKISGGECKLCGAAPVVSGMIAAQILGANRIKVLKYANSGDVTGDKSRVVGYMAAVIYKERNEKMELDEKQKERLLKIARSSIESYLKKGKIVKFEESDPLLIKKQGAFVTLTKEGKLRGCIGSMVGVMPLYETIAKMAIEAAVRDPRFPSLQMDELSKIHIEISVLSELKLIDDVNEIKVGRDGILIRKGFSSGVLLPQVAAEYGWDRTTFLEQTSRKAGLPPDAYKEGAQIYIFTAQIFGEN